MRLYKSKNRENICEQMFDNARKREQKILSLFEDAALCRGGVEKYWQKMRSYYDGTHETARKTGDFLTLVNIPWRPAQLSDGYMHIESGVASKMPDFEFAGRNACDSLTAREREKVVRYICDINDLERKNAVNERRLGIYGSAVWKTTVFENARGEREIAVENPAPESIYPDPYAASIDECEYIAQTYKMSITRASRLFSADLARLDMSIEDIVREYGDGNMEEGTVDILEWWSRQSEPGEYIDADGNAAKYSRGDIALSILICGKEVRYVPRFYRKSEGGFPFVIYSRIPRDGSLWGKSELESVIPLIDAADRQLAFAQLNSAFSANDIVVYEENAFAPESYPDNRPGAVWKLRPGMIDSVKRLGGLASESEAHYAIVEKYRTMIKETLGNYDYLQGDYSTNVTTATGLALLSDMASSRLNAKNVCKKAGFAALYRLIDAFALEFYGDEKLASITDIDDIYSASGGYIPEIDVRVRVGEGVENSRSFTLSALASLMEKDVSAENYPFVRAYLGVADIPDKASLTESLDKKFKTEEI